MKRLIAFLCLLSILLCGCGNSISIQEQTQPSTEPTLPATEAIVQTVPTEPPPTEPPFDPYAIIETMSAEELVGQLFLTGYWDHDDAVQAVEKYQYGGYILFSYNFSDETPDSIRQTIADCQAVSKIPMLMAVDEEGGSVNRVSRFSQFRESAFSSPRNLYEQGGLPLVLSTESEKTQLLSSLGINVNLAPVCDITTDPEAYMYDRSLGLSPDETGYAVVSMLQVQADGGIAGVLKHFPGYGNNADTHGAMAHDMREWSELESADLIPFQYGIDAGVGAILVSHTTVTNMDKELPASLSPVVVSYLRENMGFEGVIITDDLIMGAINTRFGAGMGAVWALQAGADLLCSSNCEDQYEAVWEALEDGSLSWERIKTSVARILTWKHEMGLL